MAGKRRRTGMVFILLALILIFGLAAVGLLFRNQLFGGGGTEAADSAAEPLATPTPAQPMVEILVLVQPVKRGALITEELVRPVFYPQEALVENLFLTDYQEIAGKKARYNLESGIPLTQNLLYDSEEGSLLAYEIPKGMVALSIPISRLTSVSYTLQPGDHVGVIASLLFIDYDPDYMTPLPNSIVPLLTQGPIDPETGVSQLEYLTLMAGGADNESVLGTIEILEGVEDGLPVYVVPSEPRQHGRMISQMIVQDAMVLYVGEHPIEPEEGDQKEVIGQENAEPADTGETAVEEEEPIIKPDLITLVVSPQDALTLNYLMLNNTKINLVMRSAGDHDPMLYETVTLDFILEQYLIPVPSTIESGMGVPYNYNAQGYEFNYPIEEENQPIIIPAE